MIFAEVIYPNCNGKYGFDEPYDYTPIINAIGDVILRVDEDDYQGDTWVLRNKEDTKYGFSPESCIEYLTPEVLAAYPHVRFRGVMGMASFTDDDEQVKQEFEQLKQLFDHLRSGVMGDAAYFDTLSMGMSHDYLMAIDKGSTMVRIGTTIFGERNY